MTSIDKQHGQLPAFQKAQLAFTATIRDPEKYQTPKGVEERRMAIYRELVFNNIEDLLANFFPVLKGITPDHKWNKLVRSFIANHKSKTPIFMKLAQEFLLFLQTEYELQNDDPDYLLELAHYEWTEIALSVETNEPDLKKIDQHGHLLSESPALSPLSWPLAYNYPVHKISPDFYPTQPSQTYLVVYRNCSDDVRFMELNVVSARLIHLLKQNEQHVTKVSGRQLLIQIAEELQHPEPEIVVIGGLQTMQQWLKREILLGTYK